MQNNNLVLGACEIVPEWPLEQLLHLLSQVGEGSVLSFEAGQAERMHKALQLWLRNRPAYLPVVWIQSKCDPCCLNEK